MRATTRPAAATASISPGVFSSITGITIPVLQYRPMVRVPLTPSDRERGERLGRLLRTREASAASSTSPCAADISAETLRKIETGRIPTPAFFTVAALATAPGTVAGRPARAPWSRSAIDDPAA